MKTILSILFSTCIILGLNAQGALSKRPLEAFSHVIIDVNIRVFLSQSDEASISISENLMDNLITEIRDGVLSIRLKGASDEKIYLKVKSLESLKLSGNAEAYASDTIRGNDFSLEMSGATDVNLLLHMNSVSFNVTGASEANLDGIAHALIGNLSGASDLNAYNLQSAKAQVDVSGSADAKINASESIKGNVSGAGSIYYTGNPAVIDVNTSALGSIKKSNGIAENSDTTRIRFGNKRIIITDENGDKEIEIGDDVLIDGKKEGGRKPRKVRPQTIWSGFEMGINGYLNADNTFSMDSLNSNYKLNYSKSISVNINFWEVHGRIIKNNLFFTTGLGSEINNYRFDQNTRLLPDSTPLLAINEGNLDYDKTKLVTAYLNAPLYLTLATNTFKNGKRLSISPGVTGGWLFRSYQKRVVNENGERNKIRTRDDFNLNPFRLNASLRIGYGSFILYGNYALNSLFQSNEGPSLTPFTIGVRIIGLGKS